MKKNNIVEVDCDGTVRISGVSPEGWMRNYIKSLFPNHIFELEERESMTDGRYNYVLAPFSEAGPQFLEVIEERAIILKETIQEASHNSLEEFYRWCICSSGSPNDRKMVAWEEVEKFRKSFSDEE